MSVTFKISDIYSQADAWEAPNADYVAINASLGPDSALNRTQAATGIANLSSRTPIVVAFLLLANPDRIYLGHTVTIYPGDPLSTTPVDSSFTVLVGSQAESCIALALHDDATRKVNAAPVATIADIVAGHQANPITLRVPFGLSQDVANVRRVLLLPPTVSGPLLTNNPRGYLDQAQFYDQLLSVIIDQGDPIVLALYNLGLQKVKHQKILNIVVTKQHEDSHVELSTSSTGLSFLIVTTNTKTPKNSHVDLYIKLTNPFGAIVAIKNILNYPPISLSSLGLLIL